MTKPTTIRLRVRCWENSLRSHSKRIVNCVASVRNSAISSYRALYERGTILTWRSIAARSDESHPTAERRGWPEVGRRSALRGGALPRGHFACRFCRFALPRVSGPVAVCSSPMTDGVTVLFGAVGAVAAMLAVLVPVIRAQGAALRREIEGLIGVCLHRIAQFVPMVDDAPTLRGVGMGALHQAVDFRV